MSYGPKVMADVANSFLLAAKRCFEQRQLPSGQIQALLVPGVVCTAFAIELNVKAILTIEKNESTGHELDKLCSKLSRDSQSVLQQRLALTESEFQRKVNEVSCAFVEWRYIYESQLDRHLDIDFLNRLADEVKKLAEDKIRNG